MDDAVGALDVVSVGFGVATDAEDVHPELALTAMRAIAIAADFFFEFMCSLAPVVVPPARANKLA